MLRQQRGIARFVTQVHLSLHQLVPNDENLIASILIWPMQVDVFENASRQWGRPL